MQKKSASGDSKPVSSAPATPKSTKTDRFAQQTADRVVEAVTAAVTNPDGTKAAMGQFNEQFNHFQDDAPACDVCGSICVRNGTCYRCFNCGNSMGCS